MAGDIIFFSLLVQWEIKYGLTGHKNTNAPLILKIWDIIFLVLGKLHNGPFLGIFRGGLDFFDPKIVPRCARDNLGVIKVLAPSKYPLKWPIM
jgi:hypothetical protein